MLKSNVFSKSKNTLLDGIYIYIYIYISLVTSFLLHNNSQSVGRPDKQKPA